MTRSGAALLVTVVAAALVTLSTSVDAATRQYFIAAEAASWDFAPSGQDLIHGGPVPKPWNGHTRWPKLRYVEYADAGFSQPVPQPPWLGILGPIIIEAGMAATYTIAP